MEYDFLVFIGRFRPFTNAHKQVVCQALEQGKHLIIIVGSSFAPRTPRSPWVFDEVSAMIKASLTDEQNSRITILPIADFLYADHLWVKRVQELVAVLARPHQKIALIGHSKDHSSYYLKLFPMWGSVNVENYHGINATAARNGYFSNISDAWLRAANDILPDPVIEYLKDWKGLPHFFDIFKDFEYVRNYHKEWGTGPFLTADAVAIQAGHILMIKRSSRPGVGLWALPGGFMDENETLLETAIRELIEETNIDMPRGAIEGSFKSSQLFDVPHRDPRARIITQAHLFNFDHELERKAKRHTGNSPLKLTSIKSGSDAAHAEWVPLGDLKQEEIFGDHYHIITKMVG